MKINEYIESGVLETYVLGSASEAEIQELLYLKTKHPQISEALRDLETDIEFIAQKMAVNPPPGPDNFIDIGFNFCPGAGRGRDSHLLGNMLQICLQFP